MTRASRRSRKRRKILKRKINIREKSRGSKASQALISPKVAKYWRQRYSLFSRYDEGIKMDEEGWFSVTPEEIAVRHAQRSVAGGVVVDCFAGMGGNSIQFAALGYHVVAIDVDPRKVEMALNNAKIYGVDNYIDFIVGDFLQLAPSLKGNVAFLSPPWGGPSYKRTQNFTLDLLKPVDGYTLFQVAQTITPNIIMFLPRNVDVCQVEELSWLSSPPLDVEIEENYVHGYLKGITAYFGNTAYWGVTEETTLHNIHEVLRLLKVHISMMPEKVTPLTKSCLLGCTTVSLLAMNKKASKKMRGFMCQSLEVTASCMTPDCRSVILSRKSTDRNLVERARLLSNTKYIRLAERRGFVVPASRRPSSASNNMISSSVGRDRHDCVKLDQNALPANQVFQVVVMRVSIHCQGCAGKVKKHLSKMEGVTSYSVDLESKRVTVMGHVSPVAVLESISKVKKAEFWPR